MTDRSNVLSPEQRAERTANENYRDLQAEVIGTVRHKLASRGMRLDDSDLEEAYCQAWHGVCETIKRGGDVSNLTGMLVEITWRRTIDIYRELRPGQRVDLELDEHSVSLDVDAQLDDQIKLKRFLKRVRGRLNPRECEAVSLCVIHGYTRPEAAELLGLERAQIEKLMDGATKKIGSIVASINARGCGEEEWARLIKSYALGLLAEDDRDHPRAAAHVAECEACQRYVNGLRGLTAILPPVALPFGPAAVAAHNGSILTQLEHLFRHGHGSTAAGAGAAGGVGGGGLAGSLGAGTLVKGAVVIAAGAAAVGLAIHASRAHHQVQPPAPAAKAQHQLPTITPEVSPGLTFNGTAAVHLAAPHPGSGKPRHPAHRHARPLDRRAVDLGARTPTRTSSEFGFENSPSSSSTAPVTVARSVASESASSARVNREFGFER